MNQSETANDWPSDDASNSDFPTSDSEEPVSASWRIGAGHRDLAAQVLEKHVLEPKVTAASTDKPWKADGTKLILSVTDRKTGKITKRFPKLDVDWSFVAKQLREWSKFLNDGKKITVTVTFNYQSVEPSKSSRGGATANQQEDLEARTAGAGRGACIRKAYALMRCPGPPCTKGDHCWQNQGKHHRLQPHHVKMLADHLQAGKKLDGHDDVPDEFRRLVVDDERDWEEREREEREKTQGRKRRRRDSVGSPTGVTVVHCHQNTPNSPATPRMAFPTTPLVKYDLPREGALIAYGVWQRSQVSTEEHREHYTAVQELSLAHCIDLDMIASNPERMFWFYIKHGIPQGIAWHYVCDIPRYFRERERDNNAR
ncbi:hypothetical protein MRS44_018542 [Fusarium solani]|uniref:uncharacterized protein n=1 Tax=Fusarium solani TaxID=169388 RepID=UPI0032C4A568|nr:hypothetical protein MRS44_018542 [Fusarium solani]